MAWLFDKRFSNFFVHFNSFGFVSCYWFSFGRLYFFSWSFWLCFRFDCFCFCFASCFFWRFGCSDFFSHFNHGVVFGFFDDFFWSGVFDFHIRSFHRLGCEDSCVRVRATGYKRDFDDFAIGLDLRLWVDLVISILDRERIVEVSFLYQLEQLLSSGDR